MHIFFASHSAELEGAERSLLTLCRASLDAADTVTVVVPKRGPLLDHLVDLGVGRVHAGPAHVCIGGRLPRFLSPYRVTRGLVDVIRVGRLLRASRPDVVVTNSTANPTASIAAALLKIPNVVMFRESLKSNAELRSLLPTGWYISMLKMVSNLQIPVSGFIASSLNVDGPISYPDVATSVSSRTLDARPRSVDAGDPLRFVMLGSVTAEKGQSDAVEAVRIARSHGHDVRLDIYGPASARSERSLLSTIKSCRVQDAVTYRGRVSDVGSVLGSAQATLVCSRNEAYGRVSGECIRAGVPVIGYRLGGTEEILKFGGGLLCDPTPAALGSLLCEWALDPAIRVALVAECAKVAANAPIFGSALHTMELIRAVPGRYTRPEVE